MNMNNIFYDHLKHAQDVIAYLDSLQIDDEEKAELVNLIDEIYHHQILNLILNHLPKSDHQEFVALLLKAPNDPNHLNYLKAKITVDIEIEIQKHSERVKDELLKEIKKTQISKPTPRKRK